MKSSESLRVDFLQRVRIVLLAIAEWSRDVCETNDNGTLAVKLPSNSKLQVQVGSSIRDSAPELSKWLLGGQRDSGSANVILSTILSDISNPSCRGYLAMAVEVIDGLISCSGDCNISSVSASDSALSSKDGITEKSLIDGSSSTILQALLLPMVDASSAENLLNSHELIRISVLMAMCGWTAISSANIAAAKSADDTPASIATSVTATGEIYTSMQVSILDSFRCDLCGRSVPFKYLLCSPVDPLYQHRTFCLWANASEQNLEVDSELKIKSEVPAGWLQCVKAVINLDNNPLITSLSQRESIGVSVQNHQDKIEHGREELCSDAEQAYKKIKLVLDRAAFNRVGQKSRQSI